MEPIPCETTRLRTFYKICNNLINIETKVKCAKAGLSVNFETNELFCSKCLKPFKLIDLKIDVRLKSCMHMLTVKFYKMYKLSFKEIINHHCVTKKFNNIRFLNHPIPSPYSKDNIDIEDDIIHSDFRFATLWRVMLRTMNTVDDCIKLAEHGFYYFHSDNIRCGYCKDIIPV